MPDPDAVFKALADPTRRRLLDELHERNGRTLGELCEPLAMSRQATSQHLAVLEAANLVTTVRQGRHKLHYLNPVPLHEIQARWIDKFEHPRLRALRAISQRAEEAMSDRPTYVYVTYIEATPEAVWEALTDADLCATWWGHRNESGWQVGDHWDHLRTDGSGISDVGGYVLEADPPTRLVLSWGPPTDASPKGHSVVTFLVEPAERIVRLTVTHHDLESPEQLAGVSQGWPAVLANLKSFLETGSPLPEEPWSMYRK